jgi:hypothetical protein
VTGLKFGRKRLIGAGALCTSASALWIAPAAVLPYAQLSPMLVFVGVVVPFGVGALTLSLMEQRIERDLQPVSRRPVPEREKVAVR